MRLLQIALPDEERDAVLDALEERGIGYVVSGGAGPHADRSVVHFALPPDAVEHVLADLTESGFDRERWTVSIDAEFAQYEGVDDVQNHWGQSPNKIAPATLRSKAKTLRSNSRSYAWMMVLSAIVAVAGLLLRSPAIVVGSMVIAPIVSPMLTASVGVVRDDREMFLSSLHQQAYGLGLAVVTASAFAYAVRELQVVPVRLAITQMELISLRVSPSMLAIAVGLAAGAAGAYGLATTGRVTILGVMIAAALIPTAGAIGIGLAWGNVVVAIGALVLLLLTIIAVNVGASAMLAYLGYRPDEVDEGVLSWDGARELAVLVATLGVAALVVTAVGVGFAQQSSFERNVNQATTDVLGAGEYEPLTIQSVSIEYDAPEAVSEETRVTVTLVRTDDREYAGLADALDREIEDRTGREVLVQVRFVDYRESSA